MADAAVQPATQRYALVTGANKGIGFEICRQLASKGIVVILASRDEKRGLEAQQRLKEFDNVVFHQLDVADPASVAAVAEFVKTKFGRLDILVNNAGILGVDVEGDASVFTEFLEAVNVSFNSLLAGGQEVPFHPKASGRVIETLKNAEECIQTNYYGAKRVTEAFIPLLHLSHSPRIVNVSSIVGSLLCQPNEWVKGVLGSDEGLTQDRIDQVVQELVKDFKEGSLEEKQWPSCLAAYKVSKAALNAYTRLKAKQNPRFLVNAVCPGYCTTDLTHNSGTLTEAEGAEAPVKLALLPHGGPSGSFFIDRDQVLSLQLASKGIGFEICRQLASKGIVVILASRDEKRGIEAQQRLKEFHNLVFHQLDVADPASVAAVAEFVKSKFGRLDILVNNAGVNGVVVDGDASLLQEYLEAQTALAVGGEKAEAFRPKASGRLIETFKGAEECVQTNYYGVKRVTEALVPLLHLSPSPRIVNVSSTLGILLFQTNEWAKGVLGSDEGLTEDRVDQVVQELLKNFKEGSLQENQWPPHFAAYKVSKAALNAYTRLIAKQNPRFLVNAVCPGYCRTDITNNSGPLSEAEGAEAPVKLALLPHGGPTGSFFLRDQLLSL